MAKKQPNLIPEAPDSLHDELRSSQKIGLPPGSLVHIGVHKKEQVSISVIDYDAEWVKEVTLDSIDECSVFRNSKTCSWININGLNDIKIIEEVGRLFDIHPLLLEDLLNTNQRPKSEDFTDYIFLTLKMLTFNQERQQVHKEQVTFILGKNYLISFQEHEGDVFKHIRDRILNGLGKVRHRSVDYLFYLLLDAVVDEYFLVTEALTDGINKLENDAIKNRLNDQVLKKILRYRGELIKLRKYVLPVREAVGKIEKSESLLIVKETNRYFKDVLDHILQVIDNSESSRETLNNVLEIHLSHSSNKMNQIMKVLTIFSAIFMPLTFVAGIYGMNFDFMPELHYKYAYPMVWSFMIIVVIIMLVYFRKKEWL